MANSATSKIATIKQTTLEKIKFGLQGMVGSQMIESTEFHIAQDYIIDLWRYKIETEILGQSREKTYKFLVPKNWFHHLKMQLGLKYKTATREITFHHRLLFPDAKYLESQFGKTVMINQLINDAQPT